MRVPRHKEEWAHIESGKVYTIICVANRTARKPGWPVTVVYHDYASIFSRPLDEFTKKMVLNKSRVSGPTRG